LGGEIQKRRGKKVEGILKKIKWAEYSEVLKARFGKIV